jgi:Double zinc ribbon
MRCPSCHHDNRSDRRFCTECGTKLALGCPSCGAPIEVGEKFCGGCGAALTIGGRTFSATPVPCGGAEKREDLRSHHGRVRAACCHPPGNGRRERRGCAASLPVSRSAFRPPWPRRNRPPRTGRSFRWHRLGNRRYPSPAIDPEQRQKRTHGVLKRILHDPAYGGLRVILLEDLHWFDGASDAYLETTIDSVPATRDLLLVTFRPAVSGD